MSLPSYVFGNDSNAYPLNNALGGSLSSGDNTVYLENKVVPETAADGKVTYTYSWKVRYEGREPILFMWTVLDRVLSGRFAFPNVLPMKNGDIYEFVLSSNEAPVWANGKAMMFQKRDMKDMLNPEGITGLNYEYYVLSPGGSQPGPLPPSLLKPLDEK
ncbi:MAG: hypothetical protein HYW90_03860 [Candidatus Sungbacteria bacterium]|nr:hypothetical protein [Candidatus Sungbacteria bacterium]